MKIALNECM